MKATLDQMIFLIKEMQRAQYKHPEAKVYYDWEDHEIRITYPLPRDFNMTKTFTKIRPDYEPTNPPPSEGEGN